MASNPAVVDGFERPCVVELSKVQHDVVTLCCMGARGKQGHEGRVEEDVADLQHNQ